MSRCFSLGSFAVLATAVFLGCTPASLSADEGMWTYDNIPANLLQERYDFLPSDQWLNHVMKSSVRFNSGGSGSFVSPGGLVLTNHHVAADAIAKLSSKDNDYMTSGFYAPSRDKELRAKDLELNVLQRIEDVTSAVQAAVKPEMSDEEKAEARRAEIAKIEKAGTEKTGLRANVVTLYQGGQYHLYYYKRYTDVRLVFAPEKAAAFFGGDEDNFEYPRWCLDMAFFRVYEDGKAVRLQNHLEWSPVGPEDGQLTFVAGNPGKTRRLNTLAHLVYHRDVVLPNVIEYLQSREASLIAYSAQSPEHARQAEKELFSVQNSRKLFLGRQAGLKDGRIVDAKAREEAELRQQVAEDPALKEHTAAWDMVEQAQKVNRNISQRYYLIEGLQGFNSELFSMARQLVRLAEEDKIPDEERLPEYQGARRAELLLGLKSKAAVYPELERWKLAHSLAFMREKLGDEHPVVKTALDGKQPEERAAELVNGTALADPEVRERYISGASDAIDSTTDTMIILAKAIDEEARKLRDEMESQVDEPEKQAYKLISDAIFRLHGTDQYPDATFTPRVAFGIVKGYREGEKVIPPMTTLGGAFDHEQAHDAEPPWKLPESWHRARKTGIVNWEAALNFVSTADIIGGNSGSPVIGRDGKLVGLIFDSNIHGLVWDYRYNDSQARAVSVASDGMLEALRSIYKADALVDELTGVKNRQ